MAWVRMGGGGNKPQVTSGIVGRAYLQKGNQTVTFNATIKGTYVFTLTGDYMASGNMNVTIRKNGSVVKSWTVLGYQYTYPVEPYMIDLNVGDVVTFATSAENGNQAAAIHYVCIA